ncbi:MAG: DMT family transporter [Candidatus Cryptobacteroides sp.]
MTDRFNKAAGHAACFMAYAIFGLNIVICKDLTGSHTFSPLALFSIRSVCAGSLFWLISLFLPHEKVERKDYVRIFIASMLGYFMCQLSFLMAIPQVTPMTSSIVSSLSPIYTMFIAAVAIKEPITVKKATGVLVSFGGMLLLIFSGMNGSGTQENTIQGILLLIVNGLSFALYLGIFKPLISKYSVCTFMKWIFLFSTAVSLPFTTGELTRLDWGRIPGKILWELGYLVFFATFVSYYLIPFGQKRLRPTLVSMYAYMQPIIATAISICIGMDTLTWQKVLSAVLVFGGVVIVSRSKSKESSLSEAAASDEAAKK